MRNREKAQNSEIDLKQKNLREGKLEIQLNEF